MRPGGLVGASRVVGFHVLEGVRVAARGTRWGLRAAPRNSLSPRTHGLRTRRRMTEVSGRLATAIVQRYRARFGRGPTQSRAYIGPDFALVILGSVQTDVERSLVAEGELDSVEFMRRRVRQMAAEEFCATTEEVVGRKVVAMLGDHNALANTSALIFLLEPEPGEAT
jgi:uncharacterized protein YbcI